MPTQTAGPQATPKPRSTAKKTAQVLMLHGGWQGHEPEACMLRFRDWLRNRGFKVRVRDSLAALTDRGAMRNVDLIIPLWTMGTLEPPQSQALLQAVRDGAGIAGWHGGMCDAFRTDTQYQFMTGGQFVCHPGNIIPYRVDIVDDTHAVTRGLTSFKVVSEQYYMHVDPGNQVLAETVISGRHGTPWVRGTRMPVVWLRTYGKGRVFYSSLGHVNADFEVPEVFEIAKRGIQWAARMRILPEYGLR